ncbi:hypothetical protein CS022_16510 [Veronia nyctiphanis]|uniref:DUF1107 domain-containing protein n=1 Tax=Veronia nyctiphanis TaxID=1278244 RepID=A0A4Q0YN10_9GAMM|nr:DUF1107 family protein [Veronia nyctiphanis]RXJ72302.1 hypothetical protein CS022_16510 [Veronia nyctiphanis]
MRMFNRYIPVMVAKHVQRLFSGRLHINGKGDFEFQKGLLQAPENAEIHHYKTVKEVNQEIRRLRTEY